VTSLHDYPGAVLGRTEGPLLEWFQRNVRGGETWLDVGAHYGYTAIALAELVGPTGRVFAFEPSLSTAGELNKTRSLNGLEQITVLPFGLGAPGPIRIVSAAIERGMANHRLGGAKTDDICIVGFDELWRSIGQGSIQGVKIDVQGMEFEALSGMTEMLRRDSPRLVLELHAGVDRAVVLGLLEKLGYGLPGAAVDAVGGEQDPQYRDDRSYAFTIGSI
jgi:FkbM family methyltransferase